MTSRREFFGLLAAAPLVAPAVVKEMAKTGNVGWIKPMRATTLSSGVGCRIIEGPFVEWTDHPQSFTARLVEISRLDGRPVRFSIEEDTPNRLYGAQINADGDAV